MDEYEAIVAGINTVLARVPGLPVYGPSGEVVNILAYPPSAIEILPTIFTLDRGGEVKYDGGQVVPTHYNMVHRLCFKWTDFETAETEARPFIIPVIQAIEADPLLGGVITRGTGCSITGWRSVFPLVGDTIYRAIDFYSLTVCKRGRVPRWVP